MTIFSLAALPGRFFNLLRNRFFSFGKGARGAAGRLGAPRWSLRLRLVSFFAVFMLCAWGMAAVFAWRESRHYIDEFFDTQQMLFAKTLLTADIDASPQRLPKTKKVLKGEKKKARGKEDKDALGFAIFSGEGELLLTDGEKGDHFPFDGQARGFSNSRINRSDDVWRMVRLVSADGGRIVAVGQELEYREDMAFDMLSEQIFPWLLLLPVLLAGLLWMISRELSPLKEVAKGLDNRPADSTIPLETRGIPSEVLPLVIALNSLFARIRTMLERERAFTSDAAHELRTPLTGLRVQAEVVALSADDADARNHAVGKLINGIDRCSRLVEQLLTLSRLEASDGAQAAHSCNGGEQAEWAALVKESVREFRQDAERKDIALTFTQADTPLPTAQAPLAGILVRNLLDNAVKYTPCGGSIAIVLDRASLAIRNSGPGVPEEYLTRLGERFFRPPGQEAPGSGLGLSIARQVAGRLELGLRFGNAVVDGKTVGFSAAIGFDG